MPSDVSSYLATHYLVADANPSKKRRRKGAKAQAGLFVEDDDDSGWARKPTEEEQDIDEDIPTTVTGTSAEFRKTKQSNWKNIGGAHSSRAALDDAAAADAILASAAAESEAAKAADDDLPLVTDIQGVVKMSDGTHAGLQTAASVSAQLEQRRREEREDFARTQDGSHEQETVYRDATGRRVDVSMRRAEARRAAAEAEEKERLAKEALRGDVQIEQAKRRREELEEAKFMPLARGADDEALNRELKEHQRWDDPMAQFLSTQAPSSSNRKSTKNRPLYSGAALPNRYGIRPGYRWDGVDRGNGLEATRFKALNRRERNKGLNYSWQMDV